MLICQFNWFQSTSAVFGRINQIVYSPHITFRCRDKSDALKFYGVHMEDRALYRHPDTCPARITQIFLQQTSNFTRRFRTDIGRGNTTLEKRGIKCQVSRTMLKQVPLAGRPSLLLPEAFHVVHQGRPWRM